MVLAFAHLCLTSLFFLTLSVCLWLALISHTNGHISYYVTSKEEEDPAVFTGDTLVSWWGALLYACMGVCVRARAHMWSVFFKICHMIRWQKPFSLVCHFSFVGGRWMIEEKKKWGKQCDQFSLAIRMHSQQIFFSPLL